MTEDRPEVELSNGVVRGVWRTHRGSRSAAFLGIPYAEAPVGPLRFEPPVTAVAWNGVLDAGAYGPTPKTDRADAATAIPEPSIAGDATLSINVFTADPDAEAARPVLVWIHGGGFTEGSPASPWYDGRSFTRDGAVTVTFGYRLGFEGFGHVPGSPENRGVRDWILALEWVRENIGRFGGDPARVTIGGQSAGGGAVLTLLSMPGVQHLFAAVYASSPTRTGIPLARARSISTNLAAAAGVEPTAEGFGTISRDEMTRLERDASGNGLDMVRSMVTELLPFGPVIDGELIERPALDGIALGIGSDKPLTIGANDDEFVALMGFAPDELRQLPAGAALAAVGVPEAVRESYLGGLSPQPTNSLLALGRFVSDHIFRSTVLAMAEARGAGPTWVYRFAWGSPTQRFADRDRAGHCLDVPFVFDVLDDRAVAAVAGPNPPQSIADDLHSALVSLVTDGTEPWPAFGDAGESHVVDTDPRIEKGSYEDARPLIVRRGTDTVTT